MSAIYAHRQPLGHASEPVAGPSSVKPSNVGVPANRRDSVASIASSCYSYGSSSSSGSSTAGYDSDDTIEEDDETKRRLTDAVEVFIKAELQARVLIEAAMAKVATASA